MPMKKYLNIGEDSEDDNEWKYEEGRAITFFGTPKPSCLDATATGLLDRQLIFAFQVKISISAWGHKSLWPHKADVQNGIKIYKL